MRWVGKDVSKEDGTPTVACKQCLNPEPFLNVHAFFAALQIEKHTS